MRDGKRQNEVNKRRQEKEREGNGIFGKVLLGVRAKREIGV